MLIFKAIDGKLHEAPKDFSIDEPDMSMLAGVEEIYVVSKTLVKQTRLVVKDKNERAQIRAENYARQAKA